MSSAETYQIILTKLNELCECLSHQVFKPKKKVEPKEKVDVPCVCDQGEERKAADDDDKDQNQLGRVWGELNDKVKDLEAKKKIDDSLTKPMEILQLNVDDILNDLKLQKSTSGSGRPIEHNVNVLRSNIIKVKIQITLQHQASKLLFDASRYLQETIFSSEEGDLPNLYGATKILEIEGSFYKEIQDKYDGLEDHALKLCLLCFAIFPEDAEIKKSLLKFWWIGERLTDLPVDAEEEKDTDRVNHILGVLVKEGFIEPVVKKSKSPATRYKMHPLVRSSLIRLAKEAIFFDYDSNGDPKKDVSLFLIKGQMVNIFPASKKACLIKIGRPELPTKGTTLRNSEMQIYLGKLQTLFNISKQYLDLHEKFSEMKNIRVLYLGRWESTVERHMEVGSPEFLKKGFENMRKLRFLSLQGISGISKLPKSIKKLINLRILDLKACHNLEELPKELLSLKRLAFLDISECYLIDNMPKELASLSELQVLKGFVISKSIHSCTLGNLAKLSKLKKLTIAVKSSEFLIDEAGEDLCELKSLRKLRIAWRVGGESSSKSLEENKDRKEIELQKLDLQCFPRRNPPSWLVPEKLGKLKSLYITHGRLSYLAELKDGKKWESVEKLRLKYLFGVQKTWTDLQTRFPNLKYLERVYCPGITFCPCDANGVWESEKEK